MNLIQELRPEATHLETQDNIKNFKKTQVSSHFCYPSLQEF